MDAPQKYIRTFASDMETLKSGGAPELVPLVEQQKESPPNLPPPPVVPQPPAAPQAVEAPIEETIPTVQKNSPLKTYAGDFADRIKATGASRVTVLATEQDAHVSAPRAEDSTPRSKGHFILGIAGGLLFLGAIAGAYFAYTRYVALSLPVPIISSIMTTIVAEEQGEVSGRGKELLEEIQQSVARPLASGSVRLLSLSPTASSSVFSMLQLPAPSVLLRNIDVELSVAGIINMGEQSPFFILRATSFGDTFSGMLQWESRMAIDLKELFPARQTTTLATTTTTSSFGELEEPVATKGFIDKSVANHDVRVLLDAEGREILLYGYWNQRTLVIARDSAVFTELLRRLALSRVYR
jgi:hypothetical protein